MFHCPVGLNNDADNIEDSCDDMDMDIIEEEAEVSRVVSCAKPFLFHLGLTIFLLKSNNNDSNGYDMDYNYDDSN